MKYDTDEALTVMESAFRHMEAAVPPPVPTRGKMGAVPRYSEKTVEQAIVLKLARLQSALRASKVLLESGYLNEQALIARTIDETNEDVLFLVYGVINDDIDSVRHCQFLDAFWNTEHDLSSDPSSLVRKPSNVRRSKIQSYIAQKYSLPDPHTNSEAMKELHMLYSGFVHGSAPHILDLYDGDPIRLQTSGLAGTRKQESHEADYWNFLYRGLQSHAFAAHVFGDAEQLADSLVKYTKLFAKSAGPRLNNNTQFKLHKRLFIADCCYKHC